MKWCCENEIDCGEKEKGSVDNFTSLAGFNAYCSSFEDKAACTKGCRLKFSPEGGCAAFDSKDVRCKPFKNDEAMCGALGCKKKYSKNGKFKKCAGVAKNLIS